MVAETVVALTVAQNVSPNKTNPLAKFVIYLSIQNHIFLSCPTPISLGGGVSEKMGDWNQVDPC